MLTGIQLYTRMAGFLFRRKGGNRLDQGSIYVIRRRGVPITIEWPNHQEDMRGYSDFSSDLQNEKSSIFSPKEVMMTSEDQR